MTESSHTTIAGKLVTLRVAGRREINLDGFWVTGRRKSRLLLIFVHGMGSNFYKSRFKKSFMRLGPKQGVDVFAFNNRGCEGDVADERFTNCLADMDAAMAFARREGYRRIILLGHSTGCQKITYYASRRKPRDVAGLILSAIGDDLAIARRDLKGDYQRWLRRAKALVAKGRGDTKLPPRCLGFTARRFLSAADPSEREANIFRFDGKLRVFRSVTLPILAAFPECEQYACIPVSEMAEILRRTTRSRSYVSIIIPRADHSFRGEEDVCVRSCLRWIRKLTD